MATVTATGGRTGELDADEQGKPFYMIHVPGYTVSPGKVRWRTREEAEAVAMKMIQDGHGDTKQVCIMQAIADMAPLPNPIILRTLVP